MNGERRSQQALAGQQAATERRASDGAAQDSNAHGASAARQSQEHRIAQLEAELSRLRRIVVALERAGAVKHS